MSLNHRIPRLARQFSWYCNWELFAETMCHTFKITALMLTGCNLIWHQTKGKQLKKEHLSFCLLMIITWYQDCQNRPCEIAPHSCLQESGVIPSRSWGWGLLAATRQGWNGKSVCFYAPKLMMNELESQDTKTGKTALMIFPLRALYRDQVSSYLIMGFMHTGSNQINGIGKSVCFYAPILIIKELPS